MVDVKCISCGKLFEVSEHVFIKTFKSIGKMLSMALLKTEKFGWICDNCDPESFQMQKTQI